MQPTDSCLEPGGPAWSFLLLALLVSMACSGTPDAASTPDKTRNDTAMAFPKQPPVEGERETLTAEMSGALVLRDGCLRLDATVGEGESYVLVWPPEHDYHLANGKVEILDGEGRVVAALGQTVHVDGGEVPAREQLQAAIRQTIPPSCGGPFWLVGKVLASH